MTRLASFLRSERGAGAAEFALVLPIFLLFLLGLIDVGRYAWALHEAEKATQIGARWAVVTDVLPNGLASYSFTVDGGLEQGSVVPVANFPGVDCNGTTSGVTCTCNTAAGGSCDFDLSANTTAFTALLGRMRQIYPGIGSQNVQVLYRNSGLGYAGDPNGPDVSPFVTVQLQNLTYPMFFMLGRRVSLPNFSYTLTLEDGSGTVSN